MTLEEQGALFLEALRRTRVAVPEGTLLYRAAGEVLEMAAAYHSDGMTFLRTGELGWLDAGSRLGLLEPSIAHPPGAAGACIPAALAARLDEKTHRYQRMLEIALSAVETGPDEASPLSRGAEELRSTARSWYTDGRGRLDAGDLAGALARFSYGYAWLDAGIRAGLFRITGERGLFTV